MDGKRLGNAASVVVTLAAAALFLAPLPQADKPRPQREKSQQTAPQKAPQAEQTPAQSATVASVSLPPPPASENKAEAKADKAAPKAPDAPAEKPREKPETIDPLEPSSAEEKAPEPQKEPAEAPDHKEIAREPLEPTETGDQAAETEVKPLAPTPEPDPEPTAPKATQAEKTAVPEPEKKQAPAPEPPEKQVSVRADETADNEDGRVLLRFLENGSGPGIQLAWPEGRGQQQALYDHMRRCLGLRTAVMNGDGKLFVDGGPAGRPWRLNTDRYSGFVRRPSGFVATAERDKARAIRRHHGLDGGAVVRVLPRRVDAALLGGLKRLLGQAYKDADRIRGRYTLAGGRLTVTGVRADGRAVDGRIAIGGCSR